MRESNRRYLVVWAYDRWEVFDTEEKISFSGSDYAFGTFINRQDAYNWIDSLD